MHDSSYTPVKMTFPCTGQACGNSIKTYSKSIFACSLFHNLSCLMTKPTKWHVHPRKTQISLGPGHPPSLIRVSAVCMKKYAYKLSTHWVHIEVSVQMPRLIRVFAGHIVGIVMKWLILWSQSYSQKLDSTMHDNFLYVNLKVWKCFTWILDSWIPTKTKFLRIIVNLIVTSHYLEIVLFPFNVITMYFFLCRYKVWILLPSTRSRCLSLPLLYGLHKSANITSNQVVLCSDIQNLLFGNPSKTYIMMPRSDQDPHCLH